VEGGQGKGFEGRKGLRASWEGKCNVSGYAVQANSLTNKVSRTDHGGSRRTGAVKRGGGGGGEP